MSYNDAATGDDATDESPTDYAAAVDDAAAAADDDAIKLTLLDTSQNVQDSL